MIQLVVKTLLFNSPGYNSGYNFKNVLLVIILILITQLTVPNYQVVPDFNKFISEPFGLNHLNLITKTQEPPL